jgi:hypothetical protein
MRNFTEKQNQLVVSILRQFGFDDVDFISKYLDYYYNEYGEYVEYPSGTYYSAKNSIDELVREKHIRSNRNILIDKKPNNSEALNATDISSYSFCPVSFSIKKSFEILYPTGIKKTNTGINLHNLQRLATKNYIKQKEIKTDKFEITNENLILKEIRQSQLIFSGHKEEKHFFFDDKYKIYSQPDYIFFKDNDYFVVEEKYQFKRDPSKNTYEENLEIWSGNSIDIFKYNKRVNDWKNYTPRFYKNHIVQILVYIKHILQYKLSYGYLIYWYYDFDENQKPYIHKCAIKKEVLDDGNNNFIENIYSRIKELQKNRIMDFEIKDLKPNKCAGCVTNKYCGHKNKKYDKFSFPYNIDYLKLY